MSRAKKATTNNIKEETIMTTTTDINLEEVEAAVPEVTPDTTPATTRPKQTIDLRPAIRPSDPQVAKIISIGTIYQFTNTIPWPHKDNLTLQSAGELIKWFNTEVEAYRATKIIYDNYKDYYKHKLDIARKIAARYPNSRINCKFTTEDTYDKKTMTDLPCDK